MNPIPTVSLVTPSLNQAPFLHPCLDSVHKQAYPRLEHVVIDGGSTDGTQEIIKAHSANLAAWTSEPDQGMYDALNKGFARTSGEIMGWLNSDDILLPGALDTVASIFSYCPEVEWVSSTTVSVWNSTGVSLGTSQIAGFSREAFLDQRYLPDREPAYGWIPQESTFWRRSLWEKAGAKLDASLELAGDFELWCRFFTSANLVGTSALIGGFRSQPKQKSRRLDAYRREARAALASLHRSSSYRPNRLRNLLLRTRVAEVPGCRRILAQSFGYTAVRVVLRESGGWQLERYRFL